MRLEKVIFDMDGLIFDSERLFMRELGQVMAKHGYKLTEENYVKTLGLAGDNLLHTVRSLYGDDYPHYEISGEARERVSRAALAGGLAVKRGIRPLLEYLRRRGIDCVVASSTQERYVSAYLQAAGLDGFFSRMIGGDEAKRSKPAPDIFVSALGGTRPENALVIEDSENGIMAANAARIAVVCIPDMVYPREEIRRMTLRTVETAADVVGAIREEFSPSVKICGLMSVDDARTANSVHTDFAGIVMFFPKSHRNRTPDEARQILGALEPEIKTVAVTVSPTVEQVRITERLGFDIIQVHGKLSDEVLESVNIPILRAFNLKNADDAVPESESDKIIGYVYDAAKPGSGKAFDWSVLKNMPRGDKLTVLAGGLNTANVRDAIVYLRPDVVDVSSGVENNTKSGKDKLKSETFVNSART